MSNDLEKSPPQALESAASSAKSPHQALERAASSAKFKTKLNTYSREKDEIPVRDFYKVTKYMQIISFYTIVAGNN